MTKFEGQWERWSKAFVQAKPRDLGLASLPWSSRFSQVPSLAHLPAQGTTSPAPLWCRPHRHQTGSPGRPSGRQPGPQRASLRLVPSGPVGDRWIYLAAEPAHCPPPPPVQGSPGGHKVLWVPGMRMPRVPQDRKEMVQGASYGSSEVSKDEGVGNHEGVQAEEQEWW